MWSETEFQRLSPIARLVLLALKTGTCSNLAGLGYAYTEPLCRDTGLPAADLEIALSELETLPSRARSFIVRDGALIWIRNQLRTDPVLENDPEIRNSKIRMAIETIAGSLPRDSPAVQKFRSFYKFRTHTVSHRGSTKGSDTPAEVPKSENRVPDMKIPKIENGPAATGTLPTHNRVAATTSTADIGPPKPRPAGDPYARFLEQAKKEHPDWSETAQTDYAVVKTRELIRAGRK